MNVKNGVAFETPFSYSGLDVLVMFCNITMVIGNVWFADFYIGCCIHEHSLSVLISILYKMQIS